PDLPKRLPLSPPVVYRYINGTEATFTGAELLLRQEVGRRFSWSTTGSYVRGDDDLFDEPVLGLAPLTGVIELETHGPDRRYGVALVTTMVDRQDRVATSRFEMPTPGYTTYDLRGSYAVNEALTLRAGVENLSDKAYSHHLNSPDPFSRQRIPEPGRSWYLSFRWGAR
ncbi:MAG: TonB-dependent receptor, partial [Thermoanaerobaculia bacterium]|nr:TonB-dependent receptor [Thermoanaerobaculia bacterium]